MRATNNIKRLYCRWKKTNSLPRFIAEILLIIFNKWYSFIANCYSSNLILIYGKHPFIINKKDKGLSNDLIPYGIREPLSSSFFINLIKEYKNKYKEFNIIDIGANIGYYVILEGKVINGSNSYIYAIEPVKQNIKLLRKNIKLNNLEKNVKIFNIGIGSKNQKEKIYIYSEKNASSFNKLNKKIEQIEEVEMNTLDNFIKSNDIKNIKFVRMDVEGYEYEIIKGMENFLKNCDKNTIIFMEFHIGLLSPQKIREILLILKKNNFEVLTAFSESWVTSSQIINSKIFGIFQLLNIIRLNCNIGNFYGNIDKFVNDPKFISGEYGTKHIFFIKK